MVQKCDLSIEPLSSSLTTSYLKLLTSKEIRKISFCEVKSPSTVNAVNLPEPEGLLDSKMGHSILAHLCGTCSLPMTSCPGHFGHIELPHPILNPLLIPEIEHILSCFCLNCFKHRTKLASFRDKQFDTFEKIHRGRSDLASKRESIGRLTNDHSKCSHCKMRIATPKRISTVAFAYKSTSIQGADGKGGKEIVLPREIREIFGRMKEQEEYFFDAYFNKDAFDLDAFVLDCIPVPANFSRGPKIMFEKYFESPRNIALEAMLLLKRQLLAEEEKQEKLRILNAMQELYIRIIDKAMVVSTSVKKERNVFLVGDGRIKGRAQRLDLNKVFEGLVSVRDTLEKKAGLFRNNLLGKRVDYCARSVISPDASIDTSEIGIPLAVARKMTVDEHVTPFNAEGLKRAIINGPDAHPGALYVTVFDRAEGRASEDGLSDRLRPPLPPSRRNLRFLSEHERKKLAHSLAEDSRVAVGRHLRDGDIVLVNRQPTLQKVSILAHRVRILPGKNVFRLHVANCKSYNADFDGDEMNIYLPQNELARAEARELALACRNFIAPTGTAPIRALVQDYVVASVLLTMKDKFFAEDRFRGLVGTFSPSIRKTLPSLLRPRVKYAGKDVITCVLHFITGRFGKTDCLRGLRFQGKSPIGKSFLNDEKVEIVNSTLVSGIIGKEQLGGKYGISHFIFELFGAEASEVFLSGYSRLLIRYLNSAGFTCGIKDLETVEEREVAKSKDLSSLPHLIKKEIKKFLDFSTSSTPANRNINMNKMSNSEKRVKIDESQPSLASRAFRVFRHTFYKTLDQSKRSLTDSTLEQSIKSKIYSSNNSALSHIVPSGLGRGLLSNGFQFMTASGSKGNTVNLAHLASSLGQQELEGRRAPRMASGKTLPCFLPFDFSPASGGFVSANFRAGLELPGFFFHCMAGREGLVDTNIKTSVSGYLERTMVKGLESLVVHYDGTVRTETLGLVQFLPGEDGLETSRSSYLPNLAPLLENAPLSSMGSSVGSGVGSSVGGDMEKSMRERARLPAGALIGVETAHAFCEPATQMTLNTFHLAGHGKANVTMGIPRLKLLINSAGSKQGDVVTTVSLAGAGRADERANRAVAGLLGQRTLGTYLRRVLVREVLPGAGNLDKFESKTSRVRVEFDFGALFGEFGDAGLRGSFLDLDWGRIIGERLFKAVKKKIVFQKLGEVGVKLAGTVDFLEDSASAIDNRDSKRGRIVVEAEGVGEDAVRPWLALAVYWPRKFKNRLNVSRAIEEICESISISKIPEIERCFVRGNKDGSYSLECVGNVLEYFLKNSGHVGYVELDNIYCNDVNAFVAVYGIEAGRNVLMNEIDSIYQSYNIEIDRRYLTLLADFMTRSGEYRGISRSSADCYSKSYWQNSTFETALTFLKKAAVQESQDNMRNSSASLIFGQAVKGGTNAFDVFYNLNK